MLSYLLLLPCACLIFSDFTSDRSLPGSVQAQMSWHKVRHASENLHSGSILSELDTSGACISPMRLIKIGQRLGCQALLQCQHVEQPTRRLQFHGRERLVVALKQRDLLHRISHSSGINDLDGPPGRRGRNVQSWNSGAVRAIRTSTSPLLSGAGTCFRSTASP